EVDGARARGGDALSWSPDAPAARRPAHNRADIARAAMEIADSEGFDAVSMRRVAQRLGAGTMTLYHYVRNKDELITLMTDAVMAEVVVPEDELSDHWRTALTQIANRAPPAPRVRRPPLDLRTHGRRQARPERHAPLRAIPPGRRRPRPQSQRDVRADRPGRRLRLRLRPP